VRNLGTFPKASADHVLAFRPCIRIQIAIVAAFAIGAAVILTVDELRDGARQFEIAERI
jgi:hypothetical protein